MVAEYVGELTLLVAPELLVNLIGFERLLEVDCSLCCKSGKDLWGHTCITGLLKEEVLSLSETEVAVHCQSFLAEICRGFSSRELRNCAQQMFVNPSRLLEEFGADLDSITA